MRRDHGSKKFFVVIAIAAVAAVAFGSWVALFVELIKKREADRHADLERDAEDRRARLQFEADLLHDLLRRLDHSYRHVKTTKRQLAARFGNDLTGAISRDELYKMLDTMSSGPQLDLEQLKKDIEVLPELDIDLRAASDSAAAGRSVHGGVAAMEDYLSKMWRQFERIYPELPDPVRFAPDLALSRLAAFVNSHSRPRAETSDLISKLGRAPNDPADDERVDPEKRYEMIYFKPAFASPYHDARQQIGIALGRRRLHTEAVTTLAGPC